MEKYIYLRFLGRIWNNSGVFLSFFNSTLFVIKPKTNPFVIECHWCIFPFHQLQSYNFEFWYEQNSLSYLYFCVWFNISNEILSNFSCGDQSQHKMDIKPISIVYSHVYCIVLTCLLLLQWQTLLLFEIDSKIPQLSSSNHKRARSRAFIAKIRKINKRNNLSSPRRLLSIVHTERNKSLCKMCVFFFSFCLNDIKRRCLFIHSSMCVVAVDNRYYK